MKYGSTAIKSILSRAKACGAPIVPLKNKKPQQWHWSDIGDDWTHAPAKVLKDERTGRRISLGQAKQILAKFVKQEKS